MKNIRILFLLLMVLGLNNSCTKDFEEINTNPNAPTAVPLTNILVQAISSGVRTVHGSGMDMTYAGLWSQHYAKIQYIDEDFYDYRPDAINAYFTGLYTGPLADLKNIIDRSNDSPNMRAAAITMWCYYFAVITDMWGNVPYSQAMDVENHLRPTYDSQKDIYADLIAKLGEAANTFDASKDALGPGDVLYGGDVNQWKKFANSLRARLMNRARGKESSYTAQLTALLNSGDLISSNGDNAQMGYPDSSPGRSNPLYSNKYNDGRNDHAVSKTLVDHMAGDPRLPVFAAPNFEGKYVGQPNGTTEPDPLTAVSPIGEAFRDDPNAPSRLMTYPEILFIKAELTGAKADFLAAVSASCDMYGVTADQAFLDKVGADFDANKDAALGTQKWIHLYGNGVEAFTEVRRTGHPANIVEVPNSVWQLGGGIPRRFPYPISEIGNNKENLDAAVDAQNLSSDNSGLLGDKMWWAK